MVNIELILFSVNRTSDKLLKKVVDNYLTNGIEVMHKKSGEAKANTQSFTADDALRTVSYITNYAQTNGMVFPGRVAGLKSLDPRILISLCTTVLERSLYGFIVIIAAVKIRTDT